MNEAYNTLGGEEEWDMEQNTEKEPSELLLKYQSYHLHLLQKRESLTIRPIIPSTKGERLSLYRCYTTSPNKSYIVDFPKEGFFFMYVIGTALKSLNHVYVNLFLASYAPEQHFFLAKMSPVFSGITFAIIVATLYELMISSTSMVFLFDYLVIGLMQRNPWNRCDQTTYTVTVNSDGEKVETKCLPLPEMMKRLDTGGNITVLNNGILMKIKDEVVTLPHIIVLMDRYFDSTTTHAIYFVLFWITVALAYNWIFRKWCWKILHVTHLMHLAIFALVYLHTNIAYFTMDTKLKYYSPTALILPTRDSTIILISNTLYYVLRGVVNHKLQMYVVSLIKTELMVKVNDENFYINRYLTWPVYFSTFTLGDIYTNIFFMINFISEFLALVIVVHCLIEVVVAEYKINRLIVSPVFCVLPIILYFTTGRMYDNLAIASKAFLNVMESLVIYLVYPLPRLIDDIYFHYGEPPTALKIFTLEMVLPVTLIIVIVSTIIVIKGHNIHINKFEYYFLSLPLVMVILGACFTLLKYYMRDIKFGDSFLPDEMWGPKDYAVRQLRKEFDSRYYIGSQASKKLSRHLMSKYESAVYRLDLYYENDRRSTLATYEYRKEPDEKEL